MNLDVQGRGLVILSGVRTAFGTMGGALKGMSATDMAVPTATAALKQAGITGEELDNACRSVITHKGFGDKCKGLLFVVS